MPYFHIILRDSDLLGSLKIHVWQRAGAGGKEKLFDGANGSWGTQQRQLVHISNICPDLPLGIYVWWWAKTKNLALGMVAYIHFMRRVSLSSSYLAFPSECWFLAMAVLTVFEIRRLTWVSYIHTLPAHILFIIFFSLIKSVFQSCFLYTTEEVLPPPQAKRW